MQEDAQQNLELLRKQVQELQEAFAHLSPNGDMNVDADPEDADDGEAAGNIGWEDIINKDHVEPQNQSTVNFVTLLRTPPPIAQLRASQASIIRYAGVPETPAARRNRVDTQLQTAQLKLENTLHLLCHNMETNNPAALGAAAAFARSAWQDLHEQRRSFLAGKQAWKLDPRPDDCRPRLLTIDEEKKIERQPRTSSTRWGSNNWNTNSWGQQQGGNRPWSGSRTRSQSAGKGKGRGKPRYQQK